MTDTDKLIRKLIGNSLGHLSSNDGYITIAEFKTINTNGLEETIDTNTALISNSLLNKIKASHVNPFVNRTGVNHDGDYTYNPSFWLYLSKTSGLRKAEPLVVSWGSGNHTTVSIDQGFLSTYNLTPRLLQEEIIWDDLKEPCYEVARNKLVSEYNFKHSEAFVQVKKDYLEDYLYLRKKTAVQVFAIKKDIFIDQDIASLLNGKEYYIEEFKQYEIRIRKFGHKENIAGLEINGYKILFQENSTDEKEEISIGHYWKGVEGLVTEWRARYEMPFEYVYVSDEVLAKYEVDDDYDVYPKNGSVNYRNQWSVSHCERVGRNGIKIGIKKLYEGNRYDVIDYWNQFSIQPSGIVEGENIAEKAERLTRKYFLFGRLFSKLMNCLFGFNLSALDIISLDEERIEYTGWSEFPDYNPITHHINLKSFSSEQFISRCKKLYVLLSENLKEKSLRKIVDHLGFAKAETKDYRSLKLLQLIVKYLNVASESGLSLIDHKETIVERVKELKDFEPMSEFFALNALRQLDAHKSGNSKSKFQDALKTLEIEPNSISNNYANACYQVYDSLNDMFSDLNIFLSEAYNLGGPQS